MDYKNFDSKSILATIRKHSLLIGGIVLIIVLVLAYTSQPASAPKVEKVKVDNAFSAAKNQTPNNAEVMQQHVATIETNQEKTNQQVMARLASLESENTQYRQAAQSAESNAAMINNKLAQLSTIKTTASGTVAHHAFKPMNVIAEDDINNDMDSSESIPLANNSSNSLGNTSNSNPKQKDEYATTYIPSNSFVKGLLIASLSANTGGNANADPTPAVIKLTDFAQLPNSFRSNIKACFVGASGWGDLSTERVKLRLTTLSCVTNSGKAIDIKVEGYVAGEDAKAGVRGVVVTHSGTLAAKAALAGFLQGIGQVGQAMGQTQTITPLGGVTSTISPSQAIYAGGGSGVSQVGQTLSQYYLNMLQQISPAIEVSARRHVTVVFTNGVELKVPLNDNVANQTLPLDE